MSSPGCSNVATAKRAATLSVQKETGGVEALELTARPLVNDPTTAYLVQVFVADAAQRAAGETSLLGSFSFLPPRIGQPQTFVLPGSSLGDASAGKAELTLSIKLVAANKSRTLKDAAVEIVGARLVK